MRLNATKLCFVFHASIIVLFLSSCSQQNNFVGKWSGGAQRPYGHVVITCNFTQAYVQCQWSDAIQANTGSAYEVKSVTEAVAPNASLDFLLQPDGSMIFNNGSITVTLHRVAQ